MTRPIRARAFLASKLILLSASVAAAPVIAKLVLMMVHEVPAFEMAAVAGQ